MTGIYCKLTDKKFHSVQERVWFLCEQGGVKESEQSLEEDSGKLRRQSHKESDESQESERNQEEVSRRLPPEEKAESKKELGGISWESRRVRNR